MVPSIASAFNFRDALLQISSIWFREFKEVKEEREGCNLITGIPRENVNFLSSLIFQLLCPEYSWFIYILRWIIVNQKKNKRKPTWRKINLRDYNVGTKES